MEDNDNADMEAGECACNFLEVALSRLWEGLFWQEDDNGKDDGDK
jgi:hypothetical protein